MTFQTYEEAREMFKSLPRPSLQEFIEHCKHNFVHEAQLYGAGTLLHAIEIAERLNAVMEKKDVPAFGESEEERYLRTTKELWREEAFRLHEKLKELEEKQ